MSSENIYIEGYMLLAKLGRGAFGDVYLAQHAILSNRVVAIKIMQPTLFGYLEEVVQFLREAQILNLLEHPHILPVVNVNLYEGRPYIVTEYAPNGSLRDRLQRQPSRPLPIEEAINILSQIGQALQYAHTRPEPIIHRDLKPENILFNKKGDALLADFGIATTLGTASIKQTAMVGTIDYMAPEQFEDMICKESDQYALGCIAYELFTGHKPFNGHIASIIAKHLKEEPISPRQYNPELPLDIEKAILKAMAKQRSDRHVDITAFITALRKSTGSQIHTYPTTQTSTPSVSSKTKQHWLKEGMDHFEAKRYEEALAACEQATRLDRHDPYTYIFKGAIFSALNHKVEALAAYEQAIRLAPDDARVYTAKGNALLNFRHYEEALVSYECAIRLDPYFPDNYTGKGLALKELKYFAEALAAYEQAIRFGTDDASAYYGKGNILLHLKQYEEALVSYECAIRLAPNDTLLHLEKGLVLHCLERDEEAITAYEQAIRLDPKNLYAYYNKGISFNNLKCYKEALMAFEQVIEIDPSNAMGWYSRGHVLFDLERYEEAFAAFDRTIQLNPNNATAHVDKGHALMMLGRFEQALRAIEHAIEIDSRSLDAWRLKGFLSELLGRVEEAKQAYKKVNSLMNSK